MKNRLSKGYAIPHFDISQGWIWAAYLLEPYGPGGGYPLALIQREELWRRSGEVLEIKEQERVRLANYRQPNGNEPNRQGCPISLQRTLLGGSPSENATVTPQEKQSKGKKRKDLLIPRANNAPADAAASQTRTVRARTRIINQPIGLTVPFMGDFSGATWNIQSLHNENGSKRNRKMLRFKQILKSADFISLQETYSTKGFEKGFKAPQGCKMWWSHDPTREAPRRTDAPLAKRKGGVALAIKDSFPEALQNIQLDGSGRWQSSCPTA